MKSVNKLFLISACVAIVMGCHSNPHNTFGGPSDHPKDTAAKKRDTSSASTRTN